MTPAKFRQAFETVSKHIDYYQNTINCLRHISEAETHIYNDCYQKLDQYTRNRDALLGRMAKYNN
jgi:hypothetical protein